MATTQIWWEQIYLKYREEEEEVAEKQHLESLKAQESERYNIFFYCSDNLPNY